MPVAVSIAIIVGILGVSIAASLWATRGTRDPSAPPTDDPEARLPASGAAS